MTKASLRGLSGEYSVYVVATDRGVPVNSARIRVAIKIQGAEDNDGTPQWFEPPFSGYEFTVPEVRQLDMISVLFCLFE